MRIVAALLIAFAVIFGAGQLAPASARADGDQCFSHFIYYGLVPTGVTERTCYHPDGSYQLCRYGGFMGNGWCQDFPAPPGPPPGVGVPRSRRRHRALQGFAGLRHHRHHRNKKKEPCSTCE